MYYNAVSGHVKQGWSIQPCQPAAGSIPYFVYDYYHRDCIMKYSEQKFCERYQAWTKKKGYRYRENEARQLYRIAKDSISTLTATENTKMMVREIVTVLRAVNISIYRILSQMQVLAKQMPEYETVMAMKGVGDSIGPRLIAEIGDPRRFHSEKALIAVLSIFSFLSSLYTSCC